MMMMEARLFVGDNLAVCNTFRNNIFDMIYFDPPYCSGVEQKNLQSGLKYDDRWNSINDYISFMRPRIAEAHRTLKQSGSFFIQCDEHANAHLRIECDAIFGPANFINEIVWCYSGGGTKKVGFASKHDTILFYAKDKSSVFFNPLRTKYKQPGGRHSNGTPYNPAGKMMDDWWTDIPPVSTSSKEKNGYPTQKPALLMERLLKATTRENDIIGDFFCGSGTMVVSALTLGRRAVGIDVNEKAIDIAVNRLKSIGVQPGVFHYYRKDGVLHVERLK